jgi:PTS system nitrogen regulatory IIA component
VRIKEGMLNMKVIEFLNPEAISVSLKATQKEEAIRELVGLLSKAHSIKDKELLIKALMNRESLGSTGIGQGIGIPHAKCDVVKELVACLGISQKGVDYDSLDGEPVHIFFLLVAPEDSAGPHLKALARISRILKDKFIRDSLVTAKDKRAVIDIISKEDEKA